MSNKDLTITIDCTNPTMEFNFGKDLTPRQITFARAKMARAYRVFLKVGFIKVDHAKSQAERLHRLNEDKALQEEKRVKDLKDYEAQQARDNGKAKKDFKPTEDVAKKAEEDKALRAKMTPAQKKAATIAKTKATKARNKALKDAEEALKNETNTNENKQGEVKDGNGNSGTDGSNNGSTVGSTESAERNTGGTTGNAKF